VSENIPTLAEAAVWKFWRGRSDHGYAFSKSHGTLEDPISSSDDGCEMDMFLLTPEAQLQN
jgi:hypothetical protein